MHREAHLSPLVVGAHAEGDALDGASLPSTEPQHGFLVAWYLVVAIARGGTILVLKPGIRPLWHLSRCREDEVLRRLVVLHDSVYHLGGMHASRHHEQHSHGDGLEY